MQAPQKNRYFYVVPFGLLSRILTVYYQLPTHPLAPPTSGAFSIFVPMKKHLLIAFLLACTLPAFAQYEALTGVAAGLGAGGAQ